MTIIIIKNKEFRVNTFPPLVGRKLMTCGSKIRGIMDKPLEDWIPFLEYVEVGFGSDIWFPLSTLAMVENHVPENARAELLMTVLTHNCSQVESLISGPTVADALWAELFNAVEEGFK